MTTRDVQKSRVYAAETLVEKILDRTHLAPTIDFYGSTLALPVERKFGDLESIQRYVDQVLELNWIQQTWTRASAPLTVCKRRGQSRAHYSPRHQALFFPDQRDGRFTMREFYVLHEVAHHLDTSYEASHGPAFTGILLRLVSGIIGPEAGLLLTDAYAKTAVQVEQLL